MLSIVTAYYNRKELLYNTLKSIRQTSEIDFEFVIADDASDQEHRLEDLQSEFPFIKIIRIEPEEKTWINPCVPFNRAINASKGDIIILQNPECFHVGDLLKSVKENLTEDSYYVAGCYALSEARTNLLTEIAEKPLDDIWQEMLPLPNRTPINSAGMAWYNHSKYRPAGYHFFSAITRNNMERLGGFDERYADGIAYDDDEILCRIKRMGLKINFIDSPLVFHQWHYWPNNFNERAQENRSLVNANYQIYTGKTQRETSFRANL